MIDRIFAVIKWPVAVLLLFLLPASLMAFWDTLVAIGRNMGVHWVFFASFVAYWLTWMLFLRKPAWGSMFSTLEHEFTHALFAMLTGHRVRGLRTSWRDGGEVKFTGKGNWLITISPYFFPTLSVFVALALSLVPGQVPTWAGLLLGLTMSYHATSTYKETHRNQPDIHREGVIFAFAFLPAANVLSYGILLAFVEGGRGGGIDYVQSVWGYAGDTLGFVLGLFG